MHGMICRTLETFLCVRHGVEAWRDIRTRAGLPELTFEAMQVYPDDDFLAVVAASAEYADRPVSAILEDVGTWVCTHPPLEPVRRLIRFSGRTYADLIWSLDELHDRARLAVPELDFPDCTVAAPGPGSFVVTASWHVAGAAAVMTGMLRAMADDYGVLAVLERGERAQVGERWSEQIAVTLVEADFATPRDFSFGASA